MKTLWRRLWGWITRSPARVIDLGSYGEWRRRPDGSWAWVPRGRTAEILGPRPSIRLVDPSPAAFLELEVCRGCGCTELRACPGGCYWVARGLCSRCYTTYGGTD